MVRESRIPALPRRAARRDGHGRRCRRYETLDDLLLYCYRVAGIVGLMMCHVMGVPTRARCCTQRTSASPCSSPTSAATCTRTGAAAACTCPTSSCGLRALRTALAGTARRAPPSPPPRARAAARGAAAARPRRAALPLGRRRDALALLALRPLGADRPPRVRGDRRGHRRSRARRVAGAGGGADRRGSSSSWPGPSGTGCARRRCAPRRLGATRGADDAPCRQ